jgi:hypothetical protein
MHCRPYWSHSKMDIEDVWGEMGELEIPRKLRDELYYERA